jgi:hypothetical protein
LLQHLDLIDDYTSFVLTLTFIGSRKKARIVEIPIVCNDNRKSRFNLWQEAKSKYKGLFSLKFKQLTGRI